ncbi:MAG TPA: GNAT family N-acetyltransferase [Candidatus Elarobacter sp.]|jgi:GNAT superfamily N-acetyltransferase|nr:GNAT family N-acetyltransferase [Candidatus Elarobacter sp.]
MTIRRAMPDDAPLLAEHRARVWREVGEWSDEELAPVIPLWASWMRTKVADGTYVAFVADDENGEPVASGAVLVHVAIPRPNWPSDRAGRVQSVYVVPAARRRGVARALMDAVVAYAQEAKLIFLSLHPSDDARPLYAAMGFTQGDEMLLRFSD